MRNDSHRATYLPLCIQHARRHTYEAISQEENYELRRYIFEPNGEKGVVFMNFGGRVINLST